MTTDMRRRLLLIAASIFTLWAVWQVSDNESQSLRTTSAKRATNTSPLAGVSPDSSKDLTLPTRAKETAPVLDLFQIAPPPVASATATETKPTAPPLPFAYLGGITELGTTQVFLKDGSRTLVAKPGTRLDGGWLLEAVEPGRLVFNYESLQQRQTLAIGDRR